MDSRSKKRISTGLGVAAAAGAALAVTAGTFAYFSDAEASPAQTAEAGTLDLTTDGTAVTAPDTVNAKPGQWSAAKSLKLKNAGTMAGTIKLSVQKTADVENGCPEQEIAAEPGCWGDSAGELGKYLTVHIQETDGTHRGSWVLAGMGPGATITLPTALNPDATRTVQIKTLVSPHAGNAVQTDKATYVVNATLVQVP